MFLNIKISKAFPGRSISYGISKNLLEYPIRRNLFDEDASPEEEMLQTAERFGKWGSREDRKSFGIVISPSPKYNPTEDQVLGVTHAVLDSFFEEYQGIVVLHKDKGADAEKENPILHAHFYGSIINPIDGNNLHISPKMVSEIRHWADDYALQAYGWKPFERTSDMVARDRYRKKSFGKVIARETYSWKLNLVAIVEKAYKESLSFSEFVHRLAGEGIRVFRDKKGMLRFQIHLGKKAYRIKASTINCELVGYEIIKRFPELKKNEGASYGRKGGVETVATEGSRSVQKSMGSRYDGRATGSGGIGKTRVDFDCLICTGDKPECKECVRQEKRKGRSREQGRLR
jgi:hypothetical protein